MAPRTLAAVARLAAGLALGATLLGCAGPRPVAPDNSYENPVLARDFPDPAVLLASDGWVYAYATQTLEADGRILNVQVARSRDLVRWEHLGDALPEKPTWASSTQDFWAPHVVQDGARYLLYYSAAPDGRRGKCLAIAIASAPTGPFRDTGAPLLCGEGIEHIDPMAFADPRSGRRFLYWGSGGLPLRVQELAADGLGFRPGSAPRDVVQAEPGSPYARLVEGAWVTVREGRYFLFFSGSRCCGRQPHYAVMVARADDPQGPFEVLRRPDVAGPAPILERGGRWLAPGHNGVLRDAAGEDWMLYHAIDTTHDGAQEGLAGRLAERRLMLDPIVWEAGWPRVPGPSSVRRPGPRPPFSDAASAR